MNSPSTALEPTLTDDIPAGETVFDLLADRRRRQVLRYLNGTENGATLTELAEEIGRREAGTEMIAPSNHAGVASDVVERIRISLHHSHVPKLTEANAVDYDPATESIELRDRGRRLLSRQAAIHGPPPDM